MGIGVAALLLAVVARDQSLTLLHSSNRCKEESAHRLVTIRWAIMGWQLLACESESLFFLFAVCRCLTVQFKVDSEI